MQKQEQSRWQEVQNAFAEKNSVAVVLLDEKGCVLCTSNDNSLCSRLLQSEYSPRCEEFCGKAAKMDSACHVKCHAGLNFYAFPLQIGNRKLRVILGRAFLKTEDYRLATQKMIEGEWAHLFSAEAFENIHFSHSTVEFERIAKKFIELAKNEPSFTELIGVELDIAEVEKIVRHEVMSFESRVDFHYWRRIFNSLLDTDYKQACNWILQFLNEKFGIADLALFQIREFSFHRVAAFGRFSQKRFRVQVFEEEHHLYEAFNRSKVLQIKIGQEGRAWFFPIVVGSKISHALLIKSDHLSEEITRRIFRFCREIRLQLEILRLRYELDRQALLTEMIKKFNRTLRKSKHIDIWGSFLQFCSDAMQSERCSLLFYDEKSRRLYVKAANGPHVEVIQREENLGRRIAYRVLKEGRPILANSLFAAGLEPAPTDWNYQSESFISFPVIIGNKKVGVLNITDRRDGSEYDEFDLEILKSVVSQVSLAVERAAFMSKADEYEQLSITDELTQLSNRRYLEARLEEEVKRSQRSGLPLAFLMIDVDDFKHYNDSFGHTEGDEVLRILANILRETLRGSDIAARYGGEEFSVLLPQTTLKEAQAIAERIRRKVEQTSFPNRQITISIGISVCRADCQPIRLVASADKALYEAKKKGKNRVEVFLGDK
ncbi:MAG: diguanylate cyclase [Pyrinomonadaceae bacterium]|nr:diguanylate cyclase [Pyrinomonadaceae bacterium]MDW8304903.1 diguanylate cyclase [Acidobacteriota bacterium]